MIDIANWSTWTSELSLLTLGLKPPHGAVGSLSSSNPALGGHRRMKCADEKPARAVSARRGVHMVSDV